MKTLDLKNVELNNFVTKLRSQGHTTYSIAEKLNSQGFTTVKGKKICNAAVSHYLIRIGMRTYRKHSAARKIKTPHPVYKKDNTAIDSQHDFLLEAITAPYLTKDQKLEIIKALVK